MGPVQERRPRRVPKKSTFQDCFEYDVPGLTAFRVKPRAANIVSSSTRIATSPAPDTTRKFEKTRTADSGGVSSRLRNSGNREEHLPGSSSSSSSRSSSTSTSRDGQRSGKTKPTKTQLKNSRSEEKSEDESVASLPKPITEKDYWQPVVLLERSDSPANEKSEPRVTRSSRRNSMESCDSQFKGRRLRSHKESPISKHQTSGQIKSKREKLGKTKTSKVEKGENIATNLEATHLEEMPIQKLNEKSPQEEMPIQKLNEKSPQEEMPIQKLNEKSPEEDQSGEQSLNEMLHDSQSRINADTSAEKEVRAINDRDVVASVGIDDSMDWSSIHVIRLIDKMESMKEATRDLFREIVALKKLVRTKQQENTLLKQQLEHYESNKLQQTLKHIIEEVAQKPSNETGNDMAHSILRQLELYAEIKTEGEEPEGLV